MDYAFTFIGICVAVFLAPHDARAWLLGAGAFVLLEIHIGCGRPDSNCRSGGANSGLTTKLECRRQVLLHQHLIVEETVERYLFPRDADARETQVE